MFLGHWLFGEGFCLTRKLIQSFCRGTPHFCFAMCLLNVKKWKPKNVTTDRMSSVTSDHTCDKSSLNCETLRLWRCRLRHQGRLRELECCEGPSVPEWRKQTYRTQLSHPRWPDGAKAEKSRGHGNSYTILKPNESRVEYPNICLNTGSDVIRTPTKASYVHQLWRQSFRKRLGTQL